MRNIAPHMTLQDPTWSTAILRMEFLAAGLTKTEANKMTGVYVARVTELMQAHVDLQGWKYDGTWGMMRGPARIGALVAALEIQADAANYVADRI